MKKIKITKLLLTNVFALFVFVFSYGQCPSSVSIYGITLPTAGQLNFCAYTTPVSPISVPYDFVLSNSLNTYNMSSTSPDGQICSSFYNVPLGTYTLLVTANSLTTCPVVTASTVVNVNTCATGVNVYSVSAGGGQIVMGASLTPANSMTYQYDFNVYGTGGYLGSYHSYPNASATFNGLNNGTYTICVVASDSSLAGVVNTCPSLNDCGVVNLSSTATTTCATSVNVYSASVGGGQIVMGAYLTPTNSITYQYDFNIYGTGGYLGSYHSYPNASATFNGLNTGSYTICVVARDSSSTGVVNACPSLNDCSLVYLLTGATNCSVQSTFNLFPDPNVVGNYYAYNNSTGNGTLSYLWNFGDGATSTLQYPFHQYATPGQYIVCLDVTSTTGTVSCTDTYCDSSSVQRMASGFLMSSITVLPSNTTTGLVESYSNLNVTAYPNPFTNNLKLDLIGVGGEVNVQVTDGIGKLVYNKKVQSQVLNINTTSFESGIYFVSISNSNGLYRNFKVVK